MRTHHEDVESLLDRLQDGDRAALARLLSLAASGTACERLSERLANVVRHPVPVVAVTGSGGVGKSSLLRVISAHFIDQGQRIGVLACDPQSPLTGGALLGDRCRITETSERDSLFVRSLSTPSGRQGIADRIDVMVSLMRDFGFDRIFVETVGTGQGETAVRSIADLVVLVLQPQSGDRLQWEKAGLLEVADVVVVNKADLPGAEQTLADLREQLQFDEDNRTPIISTSTTNRAGIDDLCRVISELAHRSSNDLPPLSSRVPVSPAPDCVTTGPVDPLLVQIADYVVASEDFSDEAWATARLCLLDSLGCGLLALGTPACRRLLGPVVPGATQTNGVRVPGTEYELDPVMAAFNIGCQIRWLDYNDTWLAAEWGHPSDNFGGLLSVADYVCRSGHFDRQLTVRDLLAAAIKAYEIQGVLALENAFNRVGLDHVLLVRVATTALATRLLGGDRQQIIDALSNAWLDGGALRTYRQAPNTGSRKSWAAGDATRRGVQLALWTLAGERGYATALSAPRWGFEEVVLSGRRLSVPQDFGSFVMENILFKVAFPAEFHAQTAAEAAMTLHPQIVDRLNDIVRIRIETQESAMRIINKTGPLANPADRDHCLQYIVAVALLHGELNAESYEDAAASDPRVDELRNRMEVVESSAYSHDYLAPEKRSIANALQVYFRDGTKTERVEIEYPSGHRRRREEARPLLREKFRRNARTVFPVTYVDDVLVPLFNSDRVETLAVPALVDLFVDRTALRFPQDPDTGSAQSASDH